ncbi:MAG: AbrB/MazE/SpoVT family DNA-binding domain-containing protein [Planctomycetota bacterium]
MLTTVQKWGNSQGLRVPKAILEKAQIAIGDDVELIAGKGKITIRAATPIRGRYVLSELLRVHPGTSDDVTWGAAQGQEEW